MSSDRPTIVDTSVLLYFLLVGHDELLRHLIGEPLRCPLSVFDPADRSFSETKLVRSDLLSEFRQAIRHYEFATQLGIEPVLLERVKKVDVLYGEGSLEYVEMRDEELRFAALLQSSEGATEHGLRMPLGPGEAACQAIAWNRDWTIASDDEDALKVLDGMSGGRTYPYERVRRLLTRAAEEDRISVSEANTLHFEMQRLGFWDSTAPFS